MPDRITSAWTEQTWLEDDLCGPLVKDIRAFLDSSTAARAEKESRPEQKREADDTQTPPRKRRKTKKMPSPTSVAELDEPGTAGSTNKRINLNCGYCMFDETSKRWKVLHYELPEELEWEAIEDEDAGTIMYLNRRYVVALLRPSLVLLYIIASHFYLFLCSLAR